MQISANHIHFFVSYGVAFLVFGLIGKWYLWPAIKGRVLKVALSPLLLYACLRVNGLMFLMPGIVSPDLPGAFAVPTAYGDLTAVILALLALATVRSESAFAVPMVWLFNVVGLFDLIYANISTFKDHVDPAQLGASYYLAVLNVPAMVVVHILIFAYLLAPPNGVSPGVCARDGTTERSMNRTRQSLYYLCSYLIVGGLVLLFFPQEGLRLLLSNGDYGDVMPRFAGMLLTGLGMSIFGIINARAETLYPRTLMIRAFFLICIGAFYVMTHDPFFLVLLAVVGFGFVLTGVSYLIETK